MKMGKFKKALMSNILIIAALIPIVALFTLIADQNPIFWLITGISLLLLFSYLQSREL